LTSEFISVIICGISKEQLRPDHSGKRWLRQQAIHQHTDANSFDRQANRPLRWIRPSSHVPLRCYHRCPRCQCAREQGVLKGQPAKGWTANQALLSQPAMDVRVWKGRGFGMTLGPATLHSSPHNGETVPC